MAETAKLHFSVYIDKRSWKPQKRSLLHCTYLLEYSGFCVKKWQFACLLTKPGLLTKPRLLTKDTGFFRQSISRSSAVFVKTVISALLVNRIVVCRKQWDPAVTFDQKKWIKTVNWQFTAIFSFDDKKLLTFRNSSRSCRQNGHFWQQIRLFYVNNGCFDVNLGYFAVNNGCFDVNNGCFDVILAVLPSIMAVLTSF